MRIEDNFARNEAIFNNKFQSISNSKKVDEKSDKLSFGDVLKNLVDDTNNEAIESSAATTKFIKGEDINIDEVMIKNQEAGLSLQFLTQTRDKLLEGYNQLSRLQL